MAVGTIRDSNIRNARRTRAESSHTNYVKHDVEIMKALRNLSTPTVSNTIESFNVRPRSTGFMNSSIKCIFPDLGVMVGYAVTGQIKSSTRPSENSLERTFQYWENIMQVPEPRIAVIEDLDDPLCLGAFWGEVNVSIHKALGCIGTVTNGGVRDLNEVRGMVFHYFATSVLVSHAYVHVVDFGKTVRVGGLEVNQGDLLHCDEHGVLQIPHSVAERIPEAADFIVEREKELIQLCNSKSFSLESLKKKLSDFRDAEKDFH